MKPKRILTSLFFALSALPFSQSALAAPTKFPIPRLKGLFSYQEKFHVPKVRRAETVDVSAPDGEERVQSLRQEGYMCIRKSQQARLCSKTWRPDQLPAGFDQSVHKFMKPITLEFAGDQNVPELIHDGSTTQEWQVHEKVQVLQSEISLYRVIKTNKDQIFVAFPVSESQPMSPLLFHSAHKLGLSIIANTKDTATSTTAYTIEAFLESVRALN